LYKPDKRLPGRRSSRGKPMSKNRSKLVLREHATGCEEGVPLKECDDRFAATGMKFTTEKASLEGSQTPAQAVSEKFVWSDGDSAGRKSWVNKDCNEKTTQATGDERDSGGRHSTSKDVEAMPAVDSLSVSENREQKGTYVLSVADSVKEGTAVLSVADSCKEEETMLSVADSCREGTAVTSAVDSCEEKKSVLSVSDSCKEGTAIESAADSCEEEKSVLSVADSCMEEKQVLSVSDSCKAGIAVESAADSCKEEKSVLSVTDSCKEGTAVESVADSCEEEKSVLSVADSCKEETAVESVADSCEEEKSVLSVADSCKEGTAVESVASSCWQVPVLSCGQLPPTSSCIANGQLPHQFQLKSGGLMAIPPYYPRPKKGRLQEYLHLDDLKGLSHEID
jgi:hypothetical protein